MKKRELRRQINALEIENSSMRGIVESANQTMGKLWDIVDPEHSSTLSMTLPDILQVHMDELRKLREGGGTVLKQVQRHADNWRDACLGAERELRIAKRRVKELETDLDAMRPVVNAVGKWMDSETDPDDVLVAAWNAYNGNPTSDESDDLDNAHGALGYVVQRASKPLPSDLDSEANRLALDAGAADTGLPIRVGDVWRHVHYGEQVIAKPDGPFAWAAETRNGTTVYMHDSARKRGEWTFVRRGATDD